MGMFFVLGIFVLGIHSVSALPQYANCASVPGSELGGRTCVNVNGCGQSFSAGNYYLLVNDDTSSGTCFNIGVPNVVFNLNNHSITFATDGGSGRGISITNSQGSVVKNGYLFQSLNVPLTSGGGGRGVDITGSSINLTLSEMTIRVQGYDSMGIRAAGIDYPESVLQIVNNTVTHNGTHLSSRGGFTSEPIKMDKVRSRVNVSYNRILDSVHSGIIVDGNGVASGSLDGSIISYNYIHSDDAYYANPTGILLYQGQSFDIHHNTIVGDGMEGIQVDNFNQAGNNRIRIYDNVMNLSCIRWPRGQSAGPGSMQGIRIRYNPRNLDIYNNHIIGRANNAPFDEQNSAIPLWLDCNQNGGNNCNDVNVYNNTFEAYTDGVGTGSFGGGNYGMASSVILGGIDQNSDLEFYNNTLISNSWVLTFYDGYTQNALGNAIRDNTFEIVGGTTYDSQTTTIEWNPVSPISFTLRDSQFFDGASKGDLNFQSSGDRITFEWTLKVKVQDSNGDPVPGASVSVSDNAPSVVGSGTTSCSNYEAVFEQVVTEGSFSPSGDISYNPHSAQASYSGDSNSGGITVGQYGEEIVITLPGTYGLSCGVAPPDADVNNDGSVNVIDLAIVIFWQGKNSGDADWDDYSHLDLDQDNDVDFSDVQVVIVNL